MQHHIIYQEATIHSIILSSKVLALFFLFTSFSLKPVWLGCPKCFYNVETVLHYRHYVEVHLRGISQERNVTRKKKMYE
jgi:hypothetical protein